MSVQMQNYLLFSFGAAINFPILALVMVTLYFPQGSRKTIYLLIGSEFLFLLVGIIGLFLAPEFLSLNIRQSFFKNFDLIIGAILLLLAIINVFYKKDEAKQARKNLENWQYFILGIVLAITNFNTLVLFISVLKNILQISEILYMRLALLGISSLILNLMIIVPLILYYISPALAQRILEPVNNFIQRHRKAIISTILFALSMILLFR